MIRTTVQHLDSHQVSYLQSLADTAKKRLGTLLETIIRHCNPRILDLLVGNKSCPEHRFFLNAVGGSRQAEPGIKTLVGQFEGLIFTQQGCRSSVNDPAANGSQPKGAGSEERKRQKAHSHGKQSRA